MLGRVHSRARASALVARGRMGQSTVPGVRQILARGFASPSDKDKGLRVNIRMLGNTLGNIVKSTDPEVFDAVEKLREKSRSWRSEGGNPDHFEDMVKDIASYDTKKLKGVARAFTHFLALANSAENHHRVRRLRERMMSSGKSVVPLICPRSGARHCLYSSTHFYYSLIYQFPYHSPDHYHYEYLFYICSP